MGASNVSMSQLEFIFIIASLMSLVALATDAMLPALGYMAQDFGVDGNAIQLVVTSVFVGHALGQLVYGPVSDTYGRKRSIFVGLGIFCVGSLISVWANSLEMMLVGRFLQGFGASGPRVMVVALVRDSFSGAAMARIMSFAMTLFMAVPIMAPLLGQGILLVGPWSWIFGFYVMFAVIMFTWVYLRLDETLKPENRLSLHPKKLWHTMLRVLLNPIAAGYSIVAGLGFGAFLGYLSSSQQIFQQLYGVGDAFPIYFSVLVTPTIVASLLNAKLVLRFGMYPLVQMSNVITGTACLAFYIYAQSLAAGPSLGQFMALCSIIFFGVGFQFGNVNALAMEPLGKLAGMGASVVGSSSTLVAVPIGMWVGMSYDGSVLPLAFGFAVASWTAFMVMLYLNSLHRSPA
ncbi:multidrug effflux MFS transporter [Candidatus Njordibacter sp. Uisw_039]|uniref:multidrug effflux MFS transporter n=1 Tax=Candidatus Njordibacter sp. Uisw_039 TaxID=3230972 RepID=UPI003D5C3036